jgi:hypothetical protein
MRIRTIAVALVVSAPFLALESPQAAAFDCWTTGHGYTAAAATTTTTVAPRRRYGYLGYNYSSPSYYNGNRIGYRGVGWRRGYGYGVGRVGRWR